MSKAGTDPTANKTLGASPWLIVAALALGLVAGMAADGLSQGVRDTSIAIVSTIGGLWLDALKMAVIPLIVALLIRAIVGGATVATEGRVAAAALAWFIGLYVLSALVGAIAMPLLLDIFPLSPTAAEAMRAGFAAVDPHSVQAGIASAGDMIRSFIPSNPFAAAASGSILQIVVFTFVFALALTALDRTKREPVVAFFNTVGEAMLVVIGWVLLVAPAGVFCLAFAAGAASGIDLFGGVLHFLILYILVGLVLLVVAYVIAVVVADLPLGAFVRSIAPTQAIAFSTQSSTGSLPAMLVSAKKLGISETRADTVLPLAAALFRVNGGSMNIAVVIFVAHVLGVHLGLAAFAAGIAVASIASISSPGLPGQVSYFTSIAPISMAMGVPIAPLGMLIAVEPVPDMFRTVTNVTMDVAVAGAVDRRTRNRENRPES